MVKRYGRIENDSVKEYREFPDDFIFPEHKLVSWRPVVDEPPDYDPEIYILAGPDLIIHDDHLEFKYTLVPKQT